MLKLYNKNWYLAVIYLVIQQIIVASSTYWIAKLAASVQSGVGFKLYFIAFILSLIIVYLPGIFSVREVEKAIYVAYQAYVERFDAVFYNKTHIAKDKTTKDHILPFISSESYLVIQGYLWFIYGAISVTLNISFNLFVLVYLLPANILISYMIGFIFAALLLLMTHKYLAKKGATAQKFRAKLQRNLSLIWDNVLWGNHYNAKRYQLETANYFKEAKSAAVSQLSVSSTISAVGMLLMMLPVLGGLGWIFLSNATSSTVLIVLVATLPRQIQILQVSYELINMLSNWATSKSQIVSLADVLKVEGEPALLKKHIKFAEIKLAGNVEHVDLAAAILPVKGRLTVRGANGIGKSCLLAWLKHELGDKAFYLPAMHELNFANSNKNMSTGEMLRTNFSEIKNHVIKAIDVLLIDEWDANLDTENIMKLDEVIDNLATEILVIEVRHR